ncbi:MAG: hypothetical protein K2I18_05615 [Paramuribaculum sp.]|nr:hypothetical protein [Paramuribaculum sp.]
MTDFKNIEELPKKKSIFPGWIESFSQKWLSLIGIAVLILSMIASNYDLIDTDAAFAVFITGLALVMLGVFCNWWSLGSDGRTTRTWLNENNTYDAVTPRAYSKLADTWFHRAAYLRKKNALEFFAVADKSIYVETKDGKAFTAPISEIDTTYTVIKGNSGETTTTKFNLSANGEKISFYSIIGMLEKEEWEDIFNLLYRSKSFTQTKSSKILGTVQNLVSEASSITEESSWTDAVLGKMQDATEKATKMKLHGSLTPIV